MSKTFKIQSNHHHLTDFHFDGNNTLEDIKIMVDQLLVKYGQNPAEYDYDIYLDPKTILNKIKLNPNYKFDTIIDHITDGHIVIRKLEGRILYKDEFNVIFDNLDAITSINLCDSNPTYRRYCLEKPPRVWLDKIRNSYPHFNPRLNGQPDLADTKKIVNTLLL